MAKEPKKRETSDLPEITIIVRAPMNVKVVIRQEDIITRENAEEDKK